MPIEECIDENKGIEGRSEKTQTLQYTSSIMTTLYDLVEDYEVTAKDAALASLPSTS